MTEKLSIAEVSYTNPKDMRILKACLEEWFKNPKDLNLTSPTMRYPFNFNQWIKTSYSNKETKTYILKNDKWIIGHMGLNIRRERNLIHIFHLFIDRQYRGNGYAKLLIDKAILFAKQNNIELLSLFVLSSNEPAINLYKSYGFSKSDEISPTGSPKYKLNIKS